jgi:hypothetical protein
VQSGADESRPGTWRTSGLARAFGWVACPLLGLLAVGSLVAAVWPDVGQDRTAMAALAAAAAAAAVVTWRCALHPRLTAGPDGLVVVNPWHTLVVPWADVAGVAPGYSGIEIARRSGRTVVAWAVQQSNMATWMGRRTRAVRTAESLAELAERHRDASPRGPGG